MQKLSVMDMFSFDFLGMVIGLGLARARAYLSTNSTFIIGRDGHVSEVATAAHAVPNRRESPTGARQSAKSG